MNQNNIVLWHGSQTSIEERSIIDYYDVDSNDEDDDSDSNDDGDYDYDAADLDGYGDNDENFDNIKERLIVDDDGSVIV